MDLSGKPLYRCLFRGTLTIEGEKKQKTNERVQFPEAWGCLCGCFNPSGGFISDRLSKKEKENGR